MGRQARVQRLPSLFALLGCRR